MNKREFLDLLVETTLKLIDEQTLMNESIEGQFWFYMMKLGFLENKLYSLSKEQRLDVDQMDKAIPILKDFCDKIYKIIEKENNYGE